MRKTILIIILGASLVLIGIGVAQLAGGGGNPEPSMAVGAGNSPDGVARISVQDLHTKLGGAVPPLVWDIRTADAFALGHISGARYVQMNEIEGLAKSLEHSRAIVTLCA